MATYPRFLPGWRGTFFPFLRASDSAIAIACLRLVTFPPLPLRSVPRFRRRIALATSLLALRLYFRLPDFFFAMRDLPPGPIRSTRRTGEAGPYPRWPRSRDRRGRGRGSGWPRLSAHRPAWGPRGLLRD